MKRYLTIAAIAATILSGCGPTTRLYQTPPIYFGSSHPVPVTDSANQLSVSASVALPVAAEFRTEYRINKNFLVNMSYAGNFGGYTHLSSNDIDYRYKTNSFDWQAGYVNKRNKVGSFIMAGFGLGNSRSIVPEYDNTVEFIYKGSFSRFTLIPGIFFEPNKQVRLTFSWRQAFVQCKRYELPDAIYFDKKQFLTDMMFRASLKAFKESWFYFFLGSYLNGTLAGDRQLDQKPDRWRIESFFLGFNLDYRFTLNKKNDR